jgi:hypothetical protein
MRYGSRANGLHSPLAYCSAVLAPYPSSGTDETNKHAHRPARSGVWRWKLDTYQYYWQLNAVQTAQYVYQLALFTPGRRRRRAYEL